MREVVLQISDEDFEAIKKKLMIDGTTRDIKFTIIEAWFRESPKFQLQSMKGELC